MVLSVSGFANAGTTTADFLKWERKAQASYLHTSITMIGVVATQTKSEIATCIDEWYFQTSQIRDKRDQEILSGMANYADYHPSTVILALVEQACGKFK